MSLDLETIDLLLKCDCISLKSHFVGTSKSDLVTLPILQLKKKLLDILPPETENRDELISRIILQLAQDEEHELAANIGNLGMECDQSIQIAQEEKDVLIIGERRPAEEPKLCVTIEDDVEIETVSPGNARQVDVDINPVNSSPVGFSFNEEFNILVKNLEMSQRASEVSRTRSRNRREERRRLRMGDEAFAAWKRTAKKQKNRPNKRQTRKFKASLNKLLAKADEVAGNALRTVVEQVTGNQGQWKMMLRNGKVIRFGAKEAADLATNTNNKSEASGFNFFSQE